MQEKLIQLIQAVLVAIVPFAVLKPVRITHRRPHRRRISRLLEL